jgi:hypothetical protein
VIVVIVHDFVLVAPQFSKIRQAVGLFKSRGRLSAVEMAVKRKVPVRPERDVPALANVRTFVSRAQENIL